MNLRFFSVAELPVADAELQMGVPGGIFELGKACIAAFGG